MSGIRAGGGARRLNRPPSWRGVLMEKKPSHAKSENQADAYTSYYLAPTTN